jgi:hypothetical protein
VSTISTDLQRIADVAAAMGKADWVATLQAAATALRGRQVVTATELQDLCEKASMWDRIETLWILGDVHLTQEEDGGWSVSLEGVECADFSVSGDDPLRVMGEVGKKIGEESSATEAG